MKYLVQYHNHNDEYQYCIVEASSMIIAESLFEEMADSLGRWFREEGWTFRQVVLLSDIEKIVETITDSEDILRETYKR